MAQPTFTEKIKTVVARCTDARNPIPGIFFLLNEWIPNNTQLKAYLESMALLLKISPRSEGDFFKLHAIKDIERDARDMDLPSFRHAMGLVLYTKSPQGNSVKTPIEPEAWSVAGFIVQQRRWAFLDQYFDALRQRSPNASLPGVKDPLAMPITEAFVAGGGMDRPLNQWLPAFRSKESKGTPAREHDLLDLATVLMIPELFHKLCRSFMVRTNDTHEVKAGYLARQAVHAFDTANNDLNALESHRGDGPLSERRVYTYFHCPGPTIAGLALVHGAKISQSAWSGTGRNARAFGLFPDQVKELIYPAISAGSVVSDAALNTTIKRMQEEGHDVVIQHRKHADANGSARDADLPIHLCVRRGQKESLLALLDAGADTNALIHTRNGATTLQVSADKNSKSGEEMMGIVKSFEARTMAMGLIDEMNLDTLPQVSFKIG